MPVERSQQAVTEVLWRGWRSAEQGAEKGGDSGCDVDCECAGNSNFTVWTMTRPFRMPASMPSAITSTKSQTASNLRN